MVGCADIVQRMADNLETQLRAKAQAHTTDVSDTKLLDYLRERDARRRHNIIKTIVWGSLALVIGWTIKNVADSNAESHRQEQQRVHDFGCAMDRDLC